MRWIVVQGADWILIPSMDDHKRSESVWRSIPCPGEKGNYTYILCCADGTFYTGWTNDLEHRLSAHNRGLGGKYTKVRCPVSLIYYESLDTKQSAMSREWHIKRLSRKQKEELVLSSDHQR